MDTKRRAELVARRSHAQTLRAHAYIRQRVEESFFGDCIVPWFLPENREIGFQQHLFAQESHNLPSPYPWVEDIWGWETVTASLSRVKAQSNAWTYPSTHISTEEAQRIDRLLEPVLVGDLCIVLPFFQTAPFAIHASNWRHVVPHARMESVLCFLRQKAVMQCDPIGSLNSGYSLLVQRA